LHKEVTNAEMFYHHIHWLQERFPKAEYEDVTGLCKLARPVDVKDQDYSLNPGRYVGVVIEEDGKTEEEFLSDLLQLNDDLERSNRDANVLGNIIGENVRALGDR
jgi:type I restriction enzyme M protein